VLMRSLSLEFYTLGGACLAPTKGAV